MDSRNVIVCALVAAAGAAAPAGDFSWIGGHGGSWSDPANWSGPAGLYPRLTVDTATLSGHLDSAHLTANTALGHLNVFDGAAVYSSGHSLFVNGDVNLFGSGSSLSVTDTPALRDLDVDTLTIAGGVLAMYGGLVEIDESVQIGSPTGGAILGVGTVQMNSTTGDLVIGKGGLWAMSGAGPETTLFIERTDSSTSRLDWSDPESDIIVWEGKIVHNRLPYTGALGGRISVSNGGPSEFISDHGFIAAQILTLQHAAAEQIELEGRDFEADLERRRGRRAGRQRDQQRQKREERPATGAHGQAFLGTCLDSSSLATDSRCTSSGPSARRRVRAWAQW